MEPAVSQGGKSSGLERQRLDLRGGHVTVRRSRAWRAALRRSRNRRGNRWGALPATALSRSAPPGTRRACEPRRVDRGSNVRRDQRNQHCGGEPEHAVARVRTRKHRATGQVARCFWLLPASVRITLGRETAAAWLHPRWQGVPARRRAHRGLHRPQGRRHPSTGKGDGVSGQRP